MTDRATRTAVALAVELDRRVVEIMAVTSMSYDHVVESARVYAEATGDTLEGALDRILAQAISGGRS